MDDRTASPGPGFKGDPDFKGKEDVKEEPDFKGQPAFKDEPDVKGEPDFKGQPVFKGEEDVKEEPDFKGQPAFKDEPDVKGEPDFKGQPVFKGEEDVKEEPDFKGLGHSKIGYFKQVRSKIKELETLNLKLARRHNRLEAVFNSMDSGLVILDKSLTIVYANHIQTRLFPGAGPGQGHCFDVFHQKDEPCRECPALKVLETEEPLSGNRFYKHGPLAGRHFEWTVSPIRDHLGKVGELLLIMRDVTKKKESELRLMQAHRMASVGFLATGIAHEINNPLTSIAGFSEGLLKRLGKLTDVLDDKTHKSFKEYLEIVNNEAYRCKEIIDRLREFTHNSSDEYEPLEIDKILGDTLVMIRQSAKDRNIRIEFDSVLSRGFNRISGKEIQLKHLFLNLFKNLFHLLEDEPHFRVRARNDGDRIEISLSDPVGFLAEEVSDNRLYELSSPSRDLENGMNLDLSVCYSIIQNHGGEIRSRPDGDKNSIITLVFPALLH